MMTDLDLDRLLESTLTSRGPQVAPASLADAVMDGVRRTRQRHARLRALDVRAWPAPRGSLVDPATVRRVRIVLVTILVMVTIGVGLIVGARLAQPADGHQLVYGSRAGGLYLMTLDGSGPRRIVAGGKYLEPRFSPDGRWIATEVIREGRVSGDGSGTGRRLVVLRADGSAVLDLNAPDPVWAYAWGAAGPSAGWLAAAIHESVVVVDPATGGRLTFDAAGAPIRAIAWSPDAPVLWYVEHGFGPGDLRSGIEAAEVHAIHISDVGGSLRITDERSFQLRLDRERRVRALEAMAVSPDGRTLAFRARTEGWFRSDLIIVEAAGGAPTYVTPPPPGEPWLTAGSGIRWVPDGSGVVVEVGDTIGPEASLVRPGILPIDGGSPRPVEAGPFTTDGAGGVVAGDGPVLASDTAILVGGAAEWINAPGGQVQAYDLWIANADGLGSRLLVSDTFGGDVR